MVNYLHIFWIYRSLWFLYYLLIFYAIVLICHAIYKQFFKELGFNHLIILIALFFIFDFFIVLYFPNPFMIIPFNLTIDLTTFFIYFSFFLFGWINSGNNANLNSLGQAGWLLLLIAILLIFPSFIWATQGKGLISTNVTFNFIMTVSYLLSAWFITLGMLGIYYRWITGYSAVLRYVTDAAYWLYLTQVPVVLIVQAYFTFLHLPLVFKLLYVYLISILIMILSYALLVRRTFIGVVLNGERK